MGVLPPCTIGLLAAEFLIDGEEMPSFRADTATGMRVSPFSDDRAVLLSGRFDVSTDLPEDTGVASADDDRAAAALDDADGLPDDGSGRGVADGEVEDEAPDEDCVAACRRSRRFSRICGR